MISQLLRRSVDLFPYSARTRIRNVPVVKGLQRWLFQTWLSGSSFAHTISAGPAKGLVYPIDLPQDKNIWTGTYEPEFATELMSHVVKGSVCYDIGGYRGFFSGVMACRGAEKVFVFEPFPDNGTQIREMIRLNPNHQIQLVPKAVSDSNDSVVFEVMPEASMGKLASSNFDSGGEEAKDSITVEQIELDRFVYEDGNPPPGLIKIDVEGAEVNVLRGASRLLQEENASLLIEVHSPEIGAQCLELLEPFGYQVRILETAMHPSNGQHPNVCHYIAVK